MKTPATVKIIREAGFKVERCGDVWKMLCCFHDDTDPSLVIYPNGGIHCFSCEWHGDALDFLQQVNDQNFVNTFNFMRDESEQRNGGKIPPDEYKGILDVCQMYVVWGQYYQALRRLHGRQKPPAETGSNGQKSNYSFFR